MNVQFPHTHDFSESDSLPNALTEFLSDLQIAGRAERTLCYYREHLMRFLVFLEGLRVATTADLNTSHIRAFLAHLSDAGHNPGGVHGYFRSIRAWCSFLHREGILEPNPVLRVRPPRLDTEPLKPATLEDIAALVEACADDERGLRDRSVLLAVLSQ